MPRNNKLRVHLRLLSLFLVLGLSFTVGGTYSWFTQSDSAANIFRTLDIRFSFQAKEVFVPPETAGPGQSVVKTVDVINTGDTPGFVRVLVLAEIISDSGTILEAEPGATFTFDGSNITGWSPGDTKMWADGRDGYFYYLDKLNPGGTTVQPLFSGVTLAAGLGPEYENAYMKIEIKAEASECAREKYRDGWWGAGDSPPGSPDLALIDNVLKELAK